MPRVTVDSLRLRCTLVALRWLRCRLRLIYVTPFDLPLLVTTLILPVTITFVTLHVTVDLPHVRTLHICPHGYVTLRLILHHVAIAFVTFVGLRWLDCCVAAAVHRLPLPTFTLPLLPLPHVDYVTLVAGYVTGYRCVTLPLRSFYLIFCHCVLPPRYTLRYRYVALPFIPLPRSIVPLLPLVRYRYHVALLFCIYHVPSLSLPAVAVATRFAFVITLPRLHVRCRSCHVAAPLPPVTTLPDRAVALCVAICHRSAVARTFAVIVESTRWVTCPPAVALPTHLLPLRLPFYICSVTFTPRFTLPPPRWLPVAVTTLRLQFGYITFLHGYVPVGYHHTVTPRLTITGYPVFTVVTLLRYVTTTFAVAFCRFAHRTTGYLPRLRYATTTAFYTFPRCRTHRTLRCWLILRSRWLDFTFITLDFDFTTHVPHHRGSFTLPLDFAFAFYRCVIYVGFWILPFAAPHLLRSADLLPLHHPTFDSPVAPLGCPDLHNLRCCPPHIYVVVCPTFCWLRCPTVAIPTRYVALRLRYVYIYVA